MVNDDATTYRALAARANFLAQDRADVQFSTKELCRLMAKPRGSSWLKLKRLARYLLDHPRLIWRFEQHGDDDTDKIDAYSDSDWAGCRTTRKSTSGGILVVAGGAVKSWSSTQKTIARSSGEAEYYGLVKTCAEALGFQAVSRYFGWEMEIRVWVDSTAAKGIACRTGLGKVRHLEVTYLWIQQALKDRKFTMHKIAGLVNPADVLTKPLSAADMKTKLATVGGHIIERTKAKRVSWADVNDEDDELAG